MKNSLGALVLLALAASGGIAHGADIPLHDWSVPRANGIRAMSETNPLPFIGLTPCRIVDTRGNGAPLTGGVMTASVPRDYALAGQCGVPAGAYAISLNITVTSTAGPGYVSAWPQGTAQPVVSTLNYVGAQTIANAAVVPVGASNGVTFACMNAGCHLIVDTNGYYAQTPAAGNGFYINANNTGYAAHFENFSATCAGACGVRGITDASVNNTNGVQGDATSLTAANQGVVGYAWGVGGVWSATGLASYSAGVKGIATAASGDVAGVWGAITSSGSHAGGVVGTATSSAADGGMFMNTAGGGVIAHIATGSFAVATNGDISTTGNLTVTGTKNFVAPHPEDPSKEIRYVAAESPTPDVFFRGTAQLVDGAARIEVPDHFRFSARGGTYMTTLTPVGGRGNLWVESEGPEGIVVRGNGDTFHYVVWAERDAIRDYQTVAPNTDFTPEALAKVNAIPSLPPGIVELLVRNGTLNPDHSFNEVTARRLGWAIPLPAVPAAPELSARP